MDYEKWCKRCKHYQLTHDRGIICILTNEKPAFEENCDLFELDKAKEKELQKRLKKEKETNKEIKKNLIIGIASFAFSVGILVYMFVNWNEMKNFVFIHRLTGIEVDPFVYFIFYFIIFFGLGIWRFNEIKNLKIKRNL